MTIKGVFKAAHKQGGFPQVKIDVIPKYATSNIGTIANIKPNGIGVRFEGMNYDTWFWANTHDDKRSRYMSQLSIINT